MTVSTPHTRTRTEAAANVSFYNRALLADLGVLYGLRYDPSRAQQYIADPRRTALDEQGWGQLVRGELVASEPTAVRMAAHNRKTEEEEEEEDATAAKRRHRAAMVGGLQLHVSRANDVLQAIDEIGPFSPSSPVARRLQRAKAEIEQNLMFWEQSIRDLEEKAARSLEPTFEFVIDLKGLHP